MDKRYLALLLTLLFGVVLVRTAWVGDDAYITMRTVDNFVHGYGLRWNTAERVQAYTHPLWMIVLSIVYAVTRDAYFTLIGIGIVVSLAAFTWVVYRASSSWPAALMAGVAMVVSKAFTDYSTSGLENPLSHLLIGLFAWLFLQGWKDARTLFRLSLVFALALMTRLDLAPLLGPAYVWRLWRAFREKHVGVREGVGAVLAGLAPLMAWELFSLVYYGFPFPNTAYAKLNTGIPRGDLVRQGLCYLMDSLRVDPVTLLTVALAIGIGFRNKTDQRAVTWGILLSLIYVVNVGGDFMTGRFLTPAFYLSIILLAQNEWPGHLPLVTTIVLAVLGLSMPKSPLRSDENYEDRHFWSYNGIADERGMFYQQAGLLRYSRENGEMPRDPHVEAGRQARYEAEAATGRVVMVHPDGTVGFFGFEAGPRVHIVDPFALADPLLARMTAEGHVTRRWRIGHFTRSIPPGYLESLRTGENRIEDRDYARFYDKLALITRGPLWSIERLKAIAAMNLGLYDSWLRGKVIFGAHAFAHRTGERKRDPEAQSDSTLEAVQQRDAEGYLAFGNYMLLKKGAYRALFRLRIGRRAPAAVARLDVTGDQGRVMLAERVVRGDEWSADGSWMTFALPFQITKKRMKNVEFRVYYLAAADIELDNVTLSW